MVWLFCCFVVLLFGCWSSKKKNKSPPLRQRDFSLLTFHSSLFTKRKSNSNSSFFILHSSFYNIILHPSHPPVFPAVALIGDMQAVYHLLLSAHLDEQLVEGQVKAYEVIHLTSHLGAAHVDISRFAIEMLRLSGAAHRLIKRVRAKPAGDTDHAEAFA